MSEVVVKFPMMKLVDAEWFVAGILKHSPGAAIHRAALLAALEPVLPLPESETTLVVPEGLTGPQLQALEAQIRTVATFYAMSAMQPAIAAVVAMVINGARCACAQAPGGSREVD